MTKKIKNNNLYVFLIHFFLFLIVPTIAIHFFDFKGMGPQSWEQIGKHFWIILLCALIGAVRVTFFSSTKDDQYEK
jgi:ABC-type uncharacterized transport system permease subunit